MSPILISEIWTPYLNEAEGALETLGFAYFGSQIAMKPDNL